MDLIGRWIAELEWFDRYPPQAYMFRDPGPYGVGEKGCCLKSALK